MHVSRNEDVCICMRRYVGVYACVCMHVKVCVCVCVLCIRVCLALPAYGGTFVHMLAYVHAFVSLHVFVQPHIHMHECMSLCQ